MGTPPRRLGIRTDDLQKCKTYWLITNLFSQSHPSKLSMSKEYPAIEGGGSLILAWQIKNKKVLVVGGGEVSFLNRAITLPTT